MGRSFTLLLLGFITLQLSASPVSKYYFPDGCQQVPFVGMQKLILVEAEVNGRTGWFLLDTGMKDLMLNKRHFPEDSLLLTADSLQLIDARGEEQVAVGLSIQSFSWGKIERRQFVARAVLMGDMEKVLKRDLLGLIGTEVLRDLELIVDYRQRLLTIRDPLAENPCVPCTGAADFEIPFAFLNHLPAIKTRVGNQNEMWLGLDTGSSLSMLDAKYKRRMRRRIRNESRINFSSPNGNYQIPLVNILGVDWGRGLEFSYWRFGFNKLEHFERSGMYLDGLIGGDLFRLGVVSLNFAENRLSIWLKESPFLQRYPPLLARAKGVDNEPDANPLACVNN